MKEIIAFYATIAGLNSVRYLLEINLLTELLNFLRHHDLLDRDILLEVIVAIGNFAGDEVEIRDYLFKNNIVLHIQEITKTKMTIEFTKWFS